LAEKITQANSVDSGLEKISRASVGISQYITPRFAAAEVGKYAAPLKARIAELEDPPAARDGHPTDKGWKFNGPLETDEATSGMFARKGVLTLDGFEGSGADWLERFKPYIQDGKTIVVAPHRVWGPESNDLVLQLRKRKISKIILGGMLANMCVESHLRELLEQGFEVAVAKDATAAPKHPEWGYGYEAALINFAFLAHAVLTTDQAVKAIEEGGP
jgi:nicotinamidase-related amidase